MRIVRIVGLAVIASAVSIALVGGSSASATETQLCASHKSLTCLNAANTVHLALKDGEVGKLLNDLETVLCLEVLALGEPLALGSPQIIHSLVKYENCGTTMGHTNCKVEVLEQPLFNLLKTGLDQGSLTAVNGLVFVTCDKVSGFLTIECEYELTDVLFPVEGQDLTALHTAVKEIGSTLLCPDEPRLDGLLKTLANRYVLQ